MNKREGSFCDLLPVENIMHNDFECLDTITDMMDFVFFQMKLGTNEVNVSKNKSMMKANKVVSLPDSSKSAVYNDPKSMSPMDDTQKRQAQLDQNMESDIHHAFETKEFQIYLQPKVLIATTEVVGAEVLARWVHPKKGLITADVFIPVFENNGFIIELDYLIWEKTFASISKWLDKGYSLVPVSINVSRIHLIDYKFVHYLIHLSKKYKVSPTYIELEFTETAIFENLDGLKPIFQALKKEGFTLSLDDFGFGYSSLNSLQDIPIDIIKIDCGLLNEISTTSNSSTIIKYIIATANKLNIRVVAEGVKDFAQAELLYHAGCDTAQGYFYSKPLSENEFEQYTYNSF